MLTSPWTKPLKKCGTANFFLEHFALVFVAYDERYCIYQNVKGATSPRLGRHAHSSARREVGALTNSSSASRTRFTLAGIVLLHCSGPFAPRSARIESYFRKNVTSACGLPDNVTPSTKPEII